MTNCKICNSNKLVVFAHTAKCPDCGVLLCYPYPEEIREQKHGTHAPLKGRERQEAQEVSLMWHISSGFRNHHNFTDMTTFCLSEADNQNHLNILDYGGGGGQFALVFKSLFPNSNVSIVDLNAERLLDCYRPLNNQILYQDFMSHEDKYDVIFLNDVYEHVTSPIEVLKMLRAKLKPNGKIFIDTPCQFWLYPITKLFSKKIHTKLLIGTVDHDHQQIWSKKSFYLSANEAGLRVTKFKTLSEYTQPPRFYLDNMGINNSFLRAMGYAFVKLAPWIASNKIMAVLNANDEHR